MRSLCNLELRAQYHLSGLAAGPSNAAILPIQLVDLIIDYVSLTKTVASLFPEGCVPLKPTSTSEQLRGKLEWSPGQTLVIDSSCTFITPAIPTPKGPIWNSFLN